MGFFRTFLGRRDASLMATLAALAAPGSAPLKIGYDPRLIDSLLRDHAELGRVFGNIGDAQKMGNYADVRPLLVQLKTRLEAHVLTENVRFYNYLQQSLAGDVTDSGTMYSFRREMNSIARSLVEFVRKYQSCAFNPEERRQFAVDYAAVGKMLEQRFDSEENNLYPLYQPI